MAVISAALLGRIRRIEVATRKLVEELLAGAWRSAFKGQGLEFEEVREYVPGDDVRTIDWNVTARMNRPFIKSFREERQMTVLLLVDVSASCRFGSEERLKSELVAELAAALAFSAIKNQDKVGIILFSDQIELYIPPKQGPQHVLRLIREILAFKPKGNKTDLQMALRFFGRVQKRSALAFVISDFLSPPNYLHELKILKNRHDLVLFGISDPLERAFPPYSCVTVKDLETGELRDLDMTDPKQREAFLEQDLPLKARKMGIDFLEFSTGAPYAQTIARFFQERKKRK